MTLTIRFKKLVPQAVEPMRGSAFAAGYDLTATAVEWDGINDVFVYHTGIAVEIPQGYVGLLFPRSSIYRQTLLKTNSVGVIDSDYRGEVLMKFADRFISSSIEPRRYKAGDRIGQLVIVPVPDVFWVQSDSLISTERGSGGYGSTGA